MPTEAPRLHRDTPTALPAGTRLGEFELLSLLGVGGFGIVYLAFDHALEREVAVKEYMPAALAGRTETMHVSLRSQSDAETFALGLRSFVNEARLLARFDHPSLLKVHRFWEGNGTAYMAMPVLRGHTVKEVRAGMTRMPDEAWVRALLTPLLGAIEKLHSEGVYHRDIAPDNIQIEPDGRPVLLDFGAARRVLSDKSQALTAILKPAYAPIEQYGEAGSVKQGPWTDIYALGATLHFLLLGRPPSPATARAIQDDASALTALNVPGCSPNFLHTIDWMLAPRPSDRPQSVAALREVLDGQAQPPRRRLPDALPVSEWDRTVVASPARPDVSQPAGGDAEATLILPRPKPGAVPTVWPAAPPGAGATLRPAATPLVHPDDGEITLPPRQLARPAEPDATLPSISMSMPKPSAGPTPSDAAPSTLRPAPAMASAASTLPVPNAVPAAPSAAAPPKRRVAGLGMGLGLGAGIAVLAVAGLAFAMWPRQPTQASADVALPAPAAVTTSAPLLGIPAPASAVPSLPESAIAAVVVPGAAALQASPSAGGTGPTSANASVNAPVNTPMAAKASTKPAAARPAAAVQAAPAPAAAGPGSTDPGYAVDAPRAPPETPSPTPAAVAEAPRPVLAGPEARCGSRAGFLYFVCMERECLRNEFTGHGDCLKWRRDAKRD